MLLSKTPKQITSHTQNREHLDKYRIEKKNAQKLKLFSRDLDQLILMKLEIIKITSVNDNNTMKFAHVTFYRLTKKRSTAKK